MAKAININRAECAGEKCDRYCDKSDVLCDSCLLSQFGLLHEAKYDSMDFLGMTELYEEEKVVKALREAIATRKLVR